MSFCLFSAERMKKDTRRKETSEKKRRGEKNVNCNEDAPHIYFIICFLVFLARQMWGEKCRKNANERYLVSVNISTFGDHRVEKKNEQITSFIEIKTKKR